MARGRDLEYRFTGKESRLFCHKFIPLIKFLSCEGDPRKQRLAALVHGNTWLYMAIHSNTW